MKPSSLYLPIRSLRVFSACLLSLLMLMAPMAPLAASVNRTAAAHAEKKTARKLASSEKKQLTPQEALESALFVNPLPPPPPIGPPNITATMSDSFVDTTPADGRADPGSTVTYTAVVTNSGGDASGVNFTATPDPNTTLVPGSIKISPLAFADTYTATINTTLNVPVLTGVLANDTGTPAPTVSGITAPPACADVIAPFVCPTTAGGTVTLAADGSFSYTPINATFTGVDTFTYSATNGQAPNDSATVTINVDAPPKVTSTTPAQGATQIGTGTNITLNFSESVNIAAGGITLNCGGVVTFLPALPQNGVSSIVIDPTPANLPTGTLCTVTGVAANITDVDTNDPPNTLDGNGDGVEGDNFTLTFTTDAPPTVASTTPTAAATSVATNTNITLNFSEAVDIAAGGITLNCAGAQTFAPALPVTNVTSFVIDPTVANLPANTLCTVTGVATLITDTDAGDPPNQLDGDNNGAEGGNFSLTFTTDSAPKVTSTTPTQGATQVATNTNITLNFSEPVDIAAGGLTLNCAGVQTFTPALPVTNVTSFVINPNTDLPVGTLCTVTGVAANIVDTDAGDPPNQLDGNGDGTEGDNFTLTFTTDAPPTVTLPTTPANLSLSNLKTTNVTINFSENVNVTAGGVTINCGAGNITFSGLPQTNVASVVLDPTSDLPPGSTCTVTVVAANVSDNDTGDPPNLLDGNADGTEGDDHVFTFGVAPDAVNDAYNSTGNVGIIIPANGVLANDVGTGATVDRVGTATANTVVPATVATSAGGSVTLNSDGSFSYTPLPGQASGTDTFKYRITNAGGVSTDGTVTITITGIVWFICNACGGSNLGTLQNPYTSINSFSTNNTGAANKPNINQRIYIRSGTYSAASENLTLLNGQLVSGQGQAATSFFTPEPNSPAAYAALTAGTRPIIAPTAGNAVTLGSANNLTQFNVGSNVSGTCAAGSSPTSGTLLTGASVGNLTISNMIDAGCGRAINFAAGGTLAVVFDSVSSANSTIGGIVVNSSAGSINFANTSVTSSGGTGVSFATNSTTLTFADLDITPASGQHAFVATDNSATITVTSGDIATLGGGRAVDINGPAGRTPINLTFNSVTTTGASNSVSLVDISGTKFQISGATQINTRAGTGVLIDNSTTTTIQFGATTIPNPSNASGYGIRIDNSSAAVTFASATISDAHTVTAQTDGNTDLIPDNDGDGDAIFLKNNTGSFTLSGGTLSNCGNDCIDGRTVQAITLTNVTINTPGQEGGGQGAGGHGISFIDLSGTSNLTGLLIQQFLTSQTDGFRTINTNKNATINVINCRFENTAAAGASDGNDGLFFEGRGSSSMTTVVNEVSPDGTHFSNFSGLFGDGIQISTGAVSSGTMNTTVKNTDFKDAYQGLTQTGSGNNGLRIAGVGGGKHVVDIQNNTFLNVSKPLFAQGVISAFINNNSEIKGTIAGNTITNATQSGIHVFADNLGGETITDMDLIIQNNTMDNISGNGIQINMTVQLGTLAGCDMRILNNNIGQTSPVGDGEAQFGFGGGPFASAEGILVTARGTAKTCNVKIDSNNVKINANGVNTTFPPANEVLELDVSENAIMNATVTNNQLLQLDDTTNGAAFFANVFGVPGVPQMCLDFRTNTGNTNVDFFILEQSTSGTIFIENLAGYQATNTGVFSTSGTLVNSAGCTEPPVGITQLLRPNQLQNGYLAARQNPEAQQFGNFAAARAARIGTTHVDPASAPARPLISSAKPAAIHDNVGSKTAPPRQPVALRTNTAETVRTAKAEPATPKPAQAVALHSNISELAKSVKARAIAEAPKMVQPVAQPRTMSEVARTVKPQAPASDKLKPVEPKRSAPQTLASRASNQEPTAARTRAFANHAVSRSATARTVSDNTITPLAAGVNVNIGTLPAGKSVTITFQVTLNTAMPSGTTQVSTQGNVFYTGGPVGGVLTDDPGVPPNTGETDPTVTPIDAPTAADSTVSGQIVDGNGNPVEGAGIRMSGTQNRLTVTDAQGFYHFDNVETNGFYTVVPTRANFTFSPSQRAFSQLGQHTDAAFSATPDGNALNPLDTTEYFVRQQYVDFLGREPDESGFNFWVNNIESCGANAQCRDVARINTSGAFFLSIEFQQTGYLVYRMYRSAYGDMPGSPVPLRLGEFRPDTAAISNGVVVLKSGWETVLENNKQVFAAEFVQRARFTSAYPTTMTPSEFVDRLFTTAGVTPDGSDRSAAISEFGSAATSADAAARGRALRRVAENSVLAQQEFNQAFVLMEYYGYLRRDANSGPDPDFSGYNFWLNKLNTFGGNFQNAEMVKAFLTSIEYRGRFPR